MQEQECFTLKQQDYNMKIFITILILFIVADGYSQAGMFSSPKKGGNIIAPQNLFLYSATPNDGSGNGNFSSPIGWQAGGSFAGDNLTITNNSGLNDLTGATTMFKVDLQSFSNNFYCVGNTTLGTTYYVSFDAKRGTSTDIKLWLFDFQHFTDYYPNTTSYYSSTSATTQRLTYSFVATGNQVFFALSSNSSPVAGTFYFDRVQLYTTVGAPYVATTTTIVP